MNTIETTRSVLATIDVQNDFIDGSLAIADAEQVIAPLNALRRAVRRAMGRVAFTRDWHPSITPHFDTWPVHCVAGTEGAAFHPTLTIGEGDIVLSKGTGQTDGYSGMEAVADDGTTLEMLVEPTHPDEAVRVFIGGLATDYCVKATAIDMARRFQASNNVSVCVITDAIKSVNLAPEDEQKAIVEMTDAGVRIVNLEDAILLINECRHGE